MKQIWRLGYDNLLRYLNPIRNKSILDYGCGSGTFCRFLSEKKAIVTGVDISENMNLYLDLEKSYSEILLQIKNHLQ